MQKLVNDLMKMSKSERKFWMGMMVGAVVLTAMSVYNILWSFAL